MNRVSAKVTVLFYLCIILSAASISWGMMPSLQEGAPKQRLERTRQLMNDVKEGKEIAPGDLCSFFSQFTDDELSGALKDQPEVIGIMTEAISDFPSAEVRACAAGSAGWYGNKKIVPVLSKALNDNDKNVRLEAAGSLLQIGSEIDAALKGVNELAQEEGAAFQILWKLFILGKDPNKWGTELLRPEYEVVLINALSSKSIGIRAYAANYFAQKRKNDPVEPVTGGDDPVETVALTILENLKGREVKYYAPEYADSTLEPIQLLNIPGKDIRKRYLGDLTACGSAMNALGEIGSKKSIPILKDIIDGKNKWSVCTWKDAKRVLEKIEANINRVE